MKPVVLVILDGWGIAPKSRGNAIELAETPHYDSFLKNYASTALEASGVAVGLKNGESGNSEAGHMNIGAGRVVMQDKLFINASIREGTFFQNPGLQKALAHMERNQSKIHLIGLLSNGDSAHSEPLHLEALLIWAKKNRLDPNRVCLHLFLDGRDTPPRRAEGLMKEFLNSLSKMKCARIVTVGGRYYGMDRAANWGRTKMAYDAFVNGRGEKFADPLKMIKDNYREGVTDEFMLPAVIGADYKSGLIAENDAVVFFNLRSDRARQLTKAFVQPEECEDKKVCQNFRKFRNLFFLTMTDYGSDLPVEVAFPIRVVQNTLPDFLGKYNDFRQLYVAEREKFAHVTYFFHGGTSIRERNETRIRVASLPVKTFDEAPQMSAPQIVDVVLSHLQKMIYKFTALNLANADMLGHTGDIDIAIKAIETIDKQLGRLAEFCLDNDFCLLITADHGNAEQMFIPRTNKVNTSHTKNPVPFIMVDPDFKDRKLRRGVLGDIAPTVLEIMGLPKPKEMTGKSLLQKN